jgi:hypothetical protein
MTVAGLWRADVDSVFFQPGKAISPEEWRAVIERAPAAARASLREKAPATREEAVRALLACVDLPISR